MRSRLRRRPMSEINVVPYIDVMLVLLVIFMITAPLLSQGVKVELPKVSSEPLPLSDKEPVIVNIDQAGLIYINYGDNQDQPISRQQLLDRVTALLKYEPGIPIFIGGDSGVAYGHVVGIMSLLQQAGAPSVGMLTDPPQR